MARDYKKRIERKQQSSQIKRRWRIVALWVVLFIFVVVGLDWVHQHRQVIKNGLPPVEDLSTQHSSAPKVSNHDNSSPTASDVKFEFYSMLPKMEVKDPDVEKTQVAEMHGETPGYWLQLGAFFTEESANEMQANLQLLGLDPLVNDTLSKSTGRHIYKVELGAYRDYTSAKQKQLELEQMKVSSLIHKVSVEAG